MVLATQLSNLGRVSSIHQSSQTIDLIIINLLLLLLSSLSHSLGGGWWCGVPWCLFHSLHMQEVCLHTKSSLFYLQRLYQSDSAPPVFTQVVFPILFSSDSEISVFRI